MLHNHGQCTEQLFQSNWSTIVRRTWEIDPAISVYIAERFNYPAVQSAVETLVRSTTQDVLDVPEGLRFLVGDKLGTSVQRDLRVSRLHST